MWLKTFKKDLGWEDFYQIQLLHTKFVKDPDFLL